MLKWIYDDDEIETYAIVYGWFINKENILTGTSYKTYYYAYHPIYGSMESQNWKAIKKIIHIHTVKTLF
jgi:hypothetical protein